MTPRPGGGGDAPPRDAPPDMPPGAPAKRPPRGAPAATLPPGGPAETGGAPADPEEEEENPEAAAAVPAAPRPPPAPAAPPGAKRKPEAPPTALDALAQKKACHGGGGGGQGGPADPRRGGLRRASSWKRASQLARHGVHTASWVYENGRRRAGRSLPKNPVRKFVRNLVVFALLWFAGLVVLLYFLFPVWIGAELIFYFTLRARRREMQDIGGRPALAAEQGLRHMRKMLETREVMRGAFPHTAEEFLQGWFPNIDICSLGEGDFRAWLAQHFLYKDIRRHRVRNPLDSSPFDEVSADPALEEADVLEAEEVALLDEYVALLQPVLREVKARRGVSEALAPGYTGAAPLRPGFNVSRRAGTPGQRRRQGRGGLTPPPPLLSQPTGQYNTFHVPLCVYFLVETLYAASGFLLRLMGFGYRRQHRSQKHGLAYWFYPNTAAKRKKAGAGDLNLNDPVVLIPGIGLGIPFYITLLRTIMQ